MTPRGWAMDDVGFSAEQLAAAHAVVDLDLGGPSRVGLAFLGGSYAVGLGHATSDVDLYVIGDGLPDIESVYTRHGIGVHTGTLKAELVHRLVSLGSEYATTGENRKQILLDFRTLNELTRLVTGVRVVCSPEWERALAPLRREVVRQILTARNANIFAALAEDVAGALVSRDLYTAVHASQLALEAAAEATLAAADDLYVGPKFLYRRLARTEVTAKWAPELWRLNNQSFGSWPSALELTGTPPDGEAVIRVRQIAERRLIAGNLLLAWCAIEGWEQPLCWLPDPPPDVCGALRSPYFAPVRFADGWALMGPQDGYEVNEPVVRLWRELGTANLDADPAAIRVLTSIGALRRAGPLTGDGLPAPNGLPIRGRGLACAGPLDRDGAEPAPGLPAGLRLELAPRFHSHPKVPPRAPTTPVDKS
jgi:hypothetical protein